MACVLPRIDTGGASLGGALAPAAGAATRVRQQGGCAVIGGSSKPSPRTLSEAANNNADASGGGGTDFMHEAEAGAGPRPHSNITISNPTSGFV